MHQRNILQTSQCCAVSLLLGFLAACSSGGSSPGVEPPPEDALRRTPSAALALAQPPSCDAVKSYVGTSIADLILNSAGYPRCLNCVLTAAGAALVETSVADARSFDEVTQTNTQESGVDELDRVEADQAGNFYILDGKHLVVANGLPPAQLREIGQLKLSDTAHPRGLMLDEANQRLVIVLSGQSLVVPAALSLVAPDIWNPGTEMLFVDVADPSNPVVDRRLLIDGFEIAARRVGSRVHLVSHFTPVMPLSVTGNLELIDLQRQHAEALADESDDADELAQRIRSTVDALVAATAEEDYLPKLWLKEGDQPFSPIVWPNCSDVAIPDVSMPFALTAVTSVDSDGGNIDSLKVANNAWNVYASEQNIYLMQTSSGWWWDRLQSQQTAIYKIAIGPGAPRYRAHGLVDGWASSSYQFSEYEDHLRVATNRRELDPATDLWLQHNSLFVLSDNGAGRLGVVGSVDEFAPGERIFSSRFVGDRGYVVTFRQIDPLFTFDLSNPSDPRLMGEVEIPGVSNYIHPLDSNHLLTIGIDGDDTGLNGDMQLQIFDVQDLTAPRRVHSFVPKFEADGFAWTSAQYDPHAFTYFASGNVLTIPVQYWASRLEDHFSGFAAFSVDVAAGFSELGRLDHSDLARNEYCPAPSLGTATVICDRGHYLESANPSRSIAATFEGKTYIYTLSDVGMKVSPADDFSNPTAVLALPYPNRYWWW